MRSSVAAVRGDRWCEDAAPNLSQSDFRAVCAAEDDGEGPLVVRDRHLEEALAELLIAGGSLTQSLLGAASVAEVEEPV